MTPYQPYASYFPKFATIVISASVLLVSGCSSSRFGQGVEVESVMSVEEQAKEAIEQAPLVFEIPLHEDSDAWERAQFFFKSYAKETVAPQVGEGTNKNAYALKSVPTSESRFLYEVKKTKSSGGFTYRISCKEQSQDSSPDATLNAKNLARFIKDGTYELSLVR